MHARTGEAHTLRVLILGAGPTGLGAGYRLRELGHDAFTICERGARVGGLASSEVDARGFTWDIGGHVMFSHYDYYDRVFERLMGNEFTLNSRESWVRLAGRWVPYPFQNNIRYLPPEIGLECLLGLIRAQAGKDVKAALESATTFGELIDQVFGDGIATHFMRPYNFKVWAHPVEALSKSWIGERVAVVDYERAIRNMVLGADDFGWGPNNRFKFPLHGGTGGFYDRFEPILRGHLRFGRDCVRIDAGTRVAHFADGSSERYDALLSTMPLDILCGRVIVGVPDRVRRAALRLRHSSGHMVGVGIRRPCPSTRSWMYFPGDECPFYRVTYLSNYSPHMTPDPRSHYSLLCETSSSDLKPVDTRSIVEETIRGLEAVELLQPGERDDIVSVWHRDVEYSYPTPTVDRDDILSEVIPWLEGVGILSRGRFGMWKYEVANTDHSLMQGVEAVDRLLSGTEETTIGMRYKVTEDGRKTGEHVRPARAGSGEKRLVEPKVNVAQEELAIRLGREED